PSLLWPRPPPPDTTTPSLHDALPIYPERIPLTTGSATWGSDNKTLFYTRKDEKTLRADRIYRHTMGTDPITDELVFTEEDETFGTYVYKTKSKKFIVIGSYSTLTSEYRVLDAANAMGNSKYFSHENEDWNTAFRTTVIIGTY